MTEQRLIDDERITTFGRLIEAHALLTKRLDDELEAAVGLPLLWYGVLLIIGRTPNGFRPMHELINATAFTSGGVTRLVDRMEQAGYVERRPCPTDRRVHYVGLTARGCEMLARATEVHLRGIQQHIMAVLAPAEVAQLDALLARLVASAEAGR
ncbi:MAG TPA: MarR family transcriptional regulator [Chloroflexota bacterium]|nr:MarR family transcriptional regulator [Chloroflexota bacterium]